MKTKISIAMFALGIIFITSCRESSKETTVIRETEQQTEREGILERTAKKVDAEVNKEIDQEIEKIGGDNQ